MKKIILKTEQDTENLAKEIADTLHGGEIIALEGDLGAGKTTFTQYLAKELGVVAHVNSPTFVIMKVYPASRGRILHLAHMDAYRLSSATQLQEIGADEYWYKPNSILVIEWAEKIKDVLDNAIWIKFELKGEERIVTL